MPVKKSKATGGSKKSMAAASKIAQPAKAAAKAAKKKSVKPKKPAKIIKLHPKKASEKIRPRLKPQEAVLPVGPKESGPQKAVAQVLEKAAAIAPAAPLKPPVEERIKEKAQKAEPVKEKFVPPPEPPKKVEVPAPIKKEEPRVIEVNIPVALKELAQSLGEKPAVLIKKLLVEHRVAANLNQSLEEDLARRISLEYGYEIKRKPTQDELIFIEHERSDPSKLKARPPIVTFMGHVDHGKTSLLDAIRKARVAESEYGGITQHIGAYAVNLPGGKITFLDTPGHEAFTAMRARGAKVTDIVVLVVAADDGIMPQTIEAIDHSREANVPIIVAINKIDKPQVDIDQVKKELAKLNLAPEDWGGKTITVGVSAKTGQGIDRLLEMILLEAEMLELKADYTKPARGVVLESKITEGKGQVATLLVEDGTLYNQDTIIAGPYYAKIRAMLNEFGRPIREAPASTPAEILGLSGLPEAGEQFFVLSDERKAKELAAKRRNDLREKALKPIKIMSLEDLSSQIKEGKVREVKFILKADMGGSIEAINESLRKLDVSEVKLKIIHQGVGNINLSDVILAQASGAIIVGFHIIADDRSKAEAVKSGIEIRTYNVIYELVNDLKTALEGLLEPKLKKTFLGRVVVRQLFKMSKAGLVAGCYVEKGKITRTSEVVVLRNGAAVYEGSVQSLKRFKDDVREVGEGVECGVSLRGFTDIMPGDIIEAYTVEKIARKL